MRGASIAVLACAFLFQQCLIEQFLKPSAALCVGSVLEQLAISLDA
jgi:hypothetical protein